MHFHPWAAVCLTGAIASSIPLASAHEMHLPYLPSLNTDHHVGSYLTLKWFMINDSLYANNDRVFPPSMSMQLHVPRWEDPEKSLTDGDEVELSYALETCPLSTEENGSTSSIVMLRVDLIDPQGQPVTPDAVVLDLLTHPDGTRRITRIRMEPGQGKREGHLHHDLPGQMRFLQTQIEAIFKHTESKQDSSSDDEAKYTSHRSKQSKPLSPQDAADPASNSAPESQVGYVFSPYWSPPTYGHHAHPHPNYRHQGSTFMRLVRPVILPAVFGAAAGLVACLMGFLIGHIFMTLSMRMGFFKRQSRPRTYSIEDGTPSEKPHLVPRIDD